MSVRVVVGTRDSVMELYDKVLIKGVSGDGALSAEVTGRASHEEYKRLLGSAVRSLGIEGNAKKAMRGCASKPYGIAADKMTGDLLGAAGSFAEALLSGAPIVVRFHNDGDGASGAVALNRSVSAIQKRHFTGDRGITWSMHRGIDYDTPSFYGDSLLFNSYKSIEKPLVLITDFGTAPGSERAIGEARGKYTLVWLDHHPVYESFPARDVPHYINTWNFGSDSNFTAGLLTCILAESLAGVSTDDMKMASLISDYSSYADRSSMEGQHSALILDYLTSIAGRRGSAIERLTPAYIESVLGDREKADAAYSAAANDLSEALELGVKNVRSYRCRDGITAFVLDFGALPRSESGFPLPGRYTSKLQEKIEGVNGEGTVTLVHYGSYITIRVSKGAAKKVGVLKIIESLLKFQDYVESGGGHNEAASVKVREGAVKNVLGMLLKELGASTASQ